ncbi:MAG: sporulation initiation factor Spo0A [Oscillospiraceae bacterium]|nr:sporulation initiation factor Spo0A [Oscillospiraceae bacterium]
MTVNEVIEQVAHELHTTPEYVRKEIQAAIMEAQHDPEPAVQARWALIPRKGDYVTVDEFLPFMADFVSSFY